MTLFKLSSSSSSSGAKEKLPSYWASVNANEPNTKNATATSTTPQENGMACVSLHGGDILRFLNFPPNHVNILIDLIRAQSSKDNWKGVQSVQKFDQATEVKLHGDPWTKVYERPLSKNRVAGFRVMIVVLKRLRELGWEVYFSPTIYKLDHSKDAVIMRYVQQQQQQQQQQNLSSQWIAVAFDRSNYLTIVDAPETLGHSIATRFGGLFVSKHFQCDERGYYEIQFRGSPWRPTGTEGVASHFIILGLLEELEKHGFQVYVALAQDNEPKYTSSDTWYAIGKHS